MATFYDTLVGEYIKNPGRKGLSLDDLSKRYFDYKMISYEEVTNKKELNFSDVSLEKAAIYSCEDVFITNKLFQKQKNEGLLEDKVLNKIEFPLIEVLKNIEINGVNVSHEKLKQIGKILTKELEKEEKIIKEIAGIDFNIKSSKQVGNILFLNLMLPSGKKTKTGYSVDNEVLENLSKDYPIAKHILNYRQYAKLLSTYIEGVGKLINKKSQKIHTSYNQTVTTTGRLSSTSPNLQNIPISTSIGGNIREAFIPFKNDDFIVSFDYSQIEVRILGVLSQEENLIGSFLQGLDIHASTGYFLFGKDSLTKEERKIAKAVNFGVIYGISPYGLSKMIQIPQYEAKLYINKFYEKYPKVLSFYYSTIKKCEETGYVETFFGRKRYIPNINDKNSIIKKASEREAINMPIQGTSADIIKLAMIEINKYLIDNKLQSKMIMQVHDELIFNVVKEELDLLKIEIKNIMENILVASIKMEVDVSFGKNWKEAK